VSNSAKLSLGDEQLNAGRVVFGLGLFSLALSVVSLSSGGGAPLWTMIPTGYYFLIWSLFLMTEGVSFDRYPKTMRLAASVTISTSLLAGWPLYSESVISLSIALAIHLFLLVLVIQATELSVGPRERQLAWTLAGVCSFGFIVGGWARSVVRLVLAGGRFGVVPLPFSVIEAFLGVVAAVLAVYLWRVRLLRSMAVSVLVCAAWAVWLSSWPVWAFSRVSMAFELHCPSERGCSPG